MRIIIATCLMASVLVAQNFTLASSDLKGQLTKTQEFNGFGCTGENISPQISWSHPPKGTKSFAITVYDPDAQIHHALAIFVAVIVGGSRLQKLLYQLFACPLGLVLPDVYGVFRLKKRVPLVIPFFSDMILSFF